MHIQQPMSSGSQSGWSWHVLLVWKYLMCRSVVDLITADYSLEIRLRFVYPAIIWSVFLRRKMEGEFMAYSVNWRSLFNIVSDVSS